MTTLDDVEALAVREQYLAVIATVRADGTVQSSLVNAGSMDHPISGVRCIAFVTYGKAKLANLRRRPQITVTFRSGWQWAAVEGTVDLFGPDDLRPAFTPDAVPALLRDVFRAAGGSHDDWDEYDRVMRDQRRVAAFVTPSRVYSN